MAKTGADVLANVRDHIDEPTANYWTDAELYRKINTRQQDLWRKVLSLRKDYFLSATGFTLTTVVNQYAYTPTAGGVPTDIWRIQSIRTTTPGSQGMQWVPGNPTSQEFIDGLNSDMPSYTDDWISYALRNQNTIWLSPLPQQVISAQVDYIQKPTAVTGAASTFLLPDEFLDWVEHMSAADALAKGPVGDNATWIAKAKEDWAGILELLDTPRSDQGPDVVLGMFGSD